MLLSRAARTVESAIETEVIAMRGAISTLPAALACFLAFACAGAANAQIHLPAIDPTGNRIFLPPPNSTTLLGPGAARGGLFGHHHSTLAATQPSGNPFARWFGHGSEAPAAHPAHPAFTHPADPEPCPGCGRPDCRNGACGQKPRGAHVVPAQGPLRGQGRQGEIIMTPHRIVAPVGSEVVVLAGICGGDGHFVLNQPLEWMLSNDSVGQIIEVGGMEHPNFNRTFPPSASKLDGQYAKGRTGLKSKLLTRGTPTPADDIEVLQGQTYISLHSASPGTTWLTCVAPQADAWDKRRATTVIHWVDGVWSIPAPVVTSSGTVQPLTATVSRMGDGSGISGWKVRYTILGGAPAEFVPTGSQTAEVETGSNGQATVQVRQQAGKVEPGTTQIRVDIVRPSVAGEQELVVESGLTGIAWSAPALTLRAIGPRSAGINEPYNYRVEVTNPGDQVARDVVVSADDLGTGVQFVSSEPKPAVYGQRYEWRLGDIAPGQAASVINIQLRSDQRGVKRTCFRVASQSDRLQTEACAETEVAAPCLGVRINGPTTVRAGEDVVLDIELVNQCDEPLENVRIAVQIDPGLSAPNHGQSIGADLGRLQFGERRNLPLTLRGVTPGVQCLALNVVVDGGHTASGRRCLEVVNVAAGHLSLQVRGPGIARQGQPFEVVASVTNTGNAPLDSVTLTNRFSPALEPSRVSEGFGQDWLGEDLALFLGRIMPGQTVSVVVQYKGREAAERAVAAFTASSPSGAQSRQQVEVRIEPGDGQMNQPGPAGSSGGGNQGIRVPPDPAGRLDVRVDAVTPTMVADGRTAGTFRFSVTNSRPVPDRNVAIVLLVPPGLQIVRFDNSQGALRLGRSADGTRYPLEVRSEMRPGEELLFAVDIVSSVPGEAVLEVQATSDNTLGTASAQGSIRVAPVR